LRRSEPAIVVGTYTRIPVDEQDAVAYLRDENGRRILVALNLGEAPRRLQLPCLTAEVLLNTHLDRTGERLRDAIMLRPDEGLIVRALEVYW
jgi:alpha-glucosidase